MTPFGLIFDFDGLILDTEVPTFEAWRRRYVHYGFDLSIEKWGACIGTGESVIDPCGDLERLAGCSFDREQLQKENRQWVLEQLAAAAPMPGVVKLLDQAREHGVRVGVASSSTRDWVAGHLERLGIFEYFDTIRTREDVRRTKPDPELFLRVLDDFGLHPKQAVVFEDSTNGVRAANAAGIHVVAVPNQLTRFLDLSTADRLVNSLEEIELVELMRSLNGSVR